MIEVLFPRVRRSILALLLAQPDRQFHLREIVRATQGGKGAVERELRALTGAGILTREERGNLALFRANRGCPIFPELHMLMVKTAGIADVIREALSQVEGIRLSFLFGSVARGSVDATSDVDVLVVGDALFADISAALLPAQKTVGREISPVVYSPEEFRLRLRGNNSFLTKVLAEPRVFLIGSDDDIQRMG